MSSCSFFVQKNLAGWIDGWIDGWVDGWMDGWMDGGEIRVKDCLQQSKRQNLDAFWASPNAEIRTSWAILYENKLNIKS